MKKVFLIGVLALLFVGCTEEILPEYGSIIGTISDKSTGEPLNNVTLTLSPTGKSATTGSDGSYEFIDLQEGQYSIQARHNNFKTDKKNVNVKAGETVRGDMMLEPKEE